jgi:hypothetical protein
LDLPSIHAKALLASALSLAASCLSFSVTSLGSAKLSVDSAGDGMTDEGGVVEESEGEDGSLMLLSIVPQRCSPILFVPDPAKQTPKYLFNLPSSIEM